MFSTVTCGKPHSPAFGHPCQRIFQLHLRLRPELAERHAPLPSQEQSIDGTQPRNLLDRPQLSMLRTKISTFTTEGRPISVSEAQLPPRNLILPLSGL